MSGVLYLENHNVIELRGLTNSVTGTSDTGAAVSVTITDRAGQSVAGHSWPANLTHIATGTYRATLEDDVAFIQGRDYFAEVSAIGSGGEKGKWRCALVAAVRGCE